MSGSAITAQEKEKAQKILNEIIRLPENKVCVDCSALGTSACLCCAVACNVGWMFQTRSESTHLQAYSRHTSMQTCNHVEMRGLCAQGQDGHR